MYKVTKDFELQSKYDAIVNTPSKESFLLKRFDPFKEDEFYFVSGQNGYFNEHIDKNGLNNIRVEDKDAKVIATLYSLALTFGKPENYGKFYYCSYGKSYEDAINKLWCYLEVQKILHKFD